MSGESAFKMRIYSGFHTDVGKVRSRNEDALYQTRIPLGYMAAVADGMGGHDHGDTAAAVTLVSIANEADKELEDPAEAIRKGFRSANEALRNESARMGVTMGATCCLALINNGNLHVGHVGDCRVYLLRGTNLYLLTRDHSLMQEIEDAKGAQVATGYDANLRHVMSRSVGAELGIDVTVRAPIALAAGDTILLCTDGLTGTVDDGWIRRTMAGATPREAARRLVEISNESGGEDNTTVIVLRVDADMSRSDIRYLSFDDLTSMFVRTSDNDLHPIVDAEINPSSWAIAALKLDLRNAARGAVCELPIPVVGPIAPDQQEISIPQSTAALVDLARRSR